MKVFLRALQSLGGANREISATAKIRPLSMPIYYVETSEVLLLLLIF